MRPVTLARSVSNQRVRFRLECSLGIESARQISLAPAARIRVSAGDFARLSARIRPSAADFAWTVRSGAIQRGRYCLECLLGIESGRPISLGLNVRVRLSSGSDQPCRFRLGCPFGIESARPISLGLPVRFRVNVGGFAWIVRSGLKLRGRFRSDCRLGFESARAISPGLCNRNRIGMHSNPNGQSERNRASRAKSPALFRNWTR